jgi:hypothetical protein
MGGSKNAFIAILIAAAGGLAAGVIIGLAVGWIVWPLKVTDIDVGDLKSSAQEDYIVMTASAFAFDQDLDKAEGRLDLLKDANINRRLSLLAKQLAPKNPKQASYLASLAVALGAQDDVLYQLAATATPTAKPTAPPTSTRAATETTAPTVAPTAGAGTRTPTRPRPTATATAKPVVIAPAPGTNWIPGFPSEWPPGANFTPANAAAGGKYWHLTKALYCDDRDERNDCPNLPGGGVGTSIYVMLLGEGGGRTSAPLVVTKNDGNVATVDDLGPEKPAEDMCNCNYSFLATNWPIKVSGNPSDTISGLGLYSVRMRLPQAHTKYFLWFQLMTR